MRRSLVLTIVLTIATFTTAVVAAQGPSRAQRGRRGGADRMSVAEVIQIMDGYAVVRAEEALQLSDTQYGTFVIRLKRLQETRRRNQRARNQIVMELRKLAGPQAPTPVDDAAVRERLKALRSHDDKSAAELRSAYDALDEVLDPRQQARFRMFEEQLERRKLDLIMRAQQAAAGRGSR